MRVSSLLAYELYKAHRPENPTGSELPIKKIYYRKNDDIEIDQKGWEEYGSKTTTKTRELQEWLSMPLSTTNGINLPDHRTGSSSLKPYIDVIGRLSKSQSRFGISLSMGSGKNRSGKNSIKHTLDLENGEIKKEIALDGAFPLRLDSTRYFVGSRTMFEEYVKSGIVNEEGMLNTDKYDEVVRKFLTHAYKSRPDDFATGTTSFRLYILPSDAPIVYRNPDGRQQPGESFTDYFGNDAKSYASSATQHTKFLTYDDPAFTINCQQEEAFYRNLGIGDASHGKIHLNSSRESYVAGLYWAFMNIGDPESNFDTDKRGILAKLHDAYGRLSHASAVSTSPSLKIVCLKKSQAKQEVLIDENLTMSRLEAMFSWIKHDRNIPPSCFEVFINNSGAQPLWDTYLHVVKSIITGNQVPREYAVSNLTKIMRSTSDLFKKPNDVRYFFTRSEFCLEYLLNTTTEQRSMTEEDNEAFAVRAGQIARLYVDFKEKGGEGSNSLSDILTYPRYDRMKLRHVLSRVQLGIQLSKITGGKGELIKKVDGLRPDVEIGDDHESDDLSYFFFKGYHTKQEEEAAVA